jgi:predicted ester cyclase
VPARRIDEEFTGTHTGEMLGEAPTHRAVAFTGICIVRAKGDQLVEGWNAFDFLTCFQQVGFNLQSWRRGDPAGPIGK